MNIFSKFSQKSRQKKLELFNNTFCPTEHTTILDVGGEINPDEINQIQFIDTYPWKKNLSVINIQPDVIKLINKHYLQINAVVGDACQLPWPDNYFDIIYSNAVIEHVGNFEKQKKMASEIMRVGKNWFVTTPNRWYPFEFHMRIPFITWLPGRLYLYAGNIISYNHVKKKYTTGIKFDDDLRLMTANDLHHAFPQSKIIKHRITFWPETLIAIGGEV